VVDLAPRFVSALDGVAVAGGRYGRQSVPPGVIVSEIREPGLALVTARKGCHRDLLGAVRSGFGVELPDTPRRVVGGNIAFVWSGPDRWLAFQHRAPKEGMEARLAPLAGLASLVDQSHGRTLLALTGSRVRDGLAKGVPVDLHPAHSSRGMRPPPSLRTYPCCCGRPTTGRATNLRSPAVWRKVSGSGSRLRPESTA